MNESQESVIRSQAILMLYRNPGKITCGNECIIDL